MDLLGQVINRALFPVWETGVKRRSTLAHLRDLERSQYRPLEELLDFQAAELRRLLRHAYENVPLYRERFLAAGVVPEDIRTPADLPKLPLLTRAEAITTEESRASTRPPLPTLRKSTGGTMGQPLRFGYDVESENWRQAVKLRGWGWGGYRLGSRVLYYWGAAIGQKLGRAQKLKVDLDRALKREHYEDCTVRSPEQLDRIARAMQRRPPDVFVCFTQSGVDLARHINREKLRRWESISVLCGAERLGDQDRAILVQAFGPHVFNTYGCREMMLIASECDRHDGLHQSIENVVVEVVVTEDGRQRPARPGECGEVVLTDLHNYGMPFIRYTNGDLAVVGTPETCACGRTLPRLASIEGRVSDTILDAEGNRVGGLVFNVLFTPLAGTVHRFQVVQHKDRSITLRVIPTERWTDDSGKLVRQMGERYLRGIPIRIEKVDDIPAARNGKMRPVVVEN